MQNNITHSKELKGFIHENKDLFWYIREEEKENISIEFLIETILNYGDIKSVKKLFYLFGIKKVAKVFQDQTNKPRVNYLPQVKNFFSLYFARHA